MPLHNRNKRYTLTPDWKYYFWSYLFSILTIPLLIGLVAFYFVRKRHKSIRYVITNTQITAVDSDYHQNMDLVGIQNIEIERTWVERKLGIGSLLIHSGSVTMNLMGIAQPEQMKEILEQAVYALQHQSDATTHKTVTEPKYKPGSMEKINYLTGLWQQGLLSDEDYQKERSRFE